MDPPERAVLRKGKPMKARLMKKWGTNYAGQVLTNVQEGSIPDGVAEFYEDDDPAVNTVVEQSNPNDPLMVINDEINPETAKTHDEAQRARADNSRAADANAVVSQLEEQERKDTQRRARDADEFAAKRGEGKDASALTETQKKSLRAGKEHGRGTSTAKAADEPEPRKAAAGKKRGRKTEK
jgi:hypothetical protein